MADMNLVGKLITRPCRTVDYRNGAHIFTNDAIETQLLLVKAGHTESKVIEEKIWQIHGWKAIRCRKPKDRLSALIIANGTMRDRIVRTKSRL